MHWGYLDYSPGNISAISNAYYEITFHQLSLTYNNFSLGDATPLNALHIYAKSCSHHICVYTCDKVSRSSADNGSRQMSLRQQQTPCNCHCHTCSIFTFKKYHHCRSYCLILTFNYKTFASFFVYFGVLVPSLTLGIRSLRIIT